MSGRRLTLDEIATAKQLAAEGWTAYKIAKLFGRCESVIQRMLQDGGKASLASQCPLEMREPTEEELAEIERRKQEVHDRVSFQRRHLNQGTKGWAIPIVSAKALGIGKGSELI